jgi:hypothetical protein
MRLASLRRPRRRRSQLSAHEDSAATDPQPPNSRNAATDPRPAPPDYDAVPFTGTYSDLGAEEELRRDYERELAEWEARQEQRVAQTYEYEVRANYHGWWDVWCRIAGPKDWFQVATLLGQKRAEIAAKALSEEANEIV